MRPAHPNILRNASPTSNFFRFTRISNAERGARRGASPTSNFFRFMSISNAGRAGTHPLHQTSFVSRVYRTRNAQGRIPYIKLLSFHEYIEHGTRRGASPTLNFFRFTSISNTERAGARPLH